MLYEIDNAINKLNSENGALEGQMDSCERQIDNINAALQFSYGLKGEAYNALRERISMRPSILQAHHVVYDAMREANRNNIAQLSRLPKNRGGSFDSEVCQQKIRDANTEIMKLKQMRDSQIYRLQMNPEPTVYAGETQYSKATNIARITRNFQAMIDTLRSVIEHENELLRMVNSYLQNSGNIYSRAQELSTKFLVPSTNSVNYCIKHGSYGNTTTWKNDLGVPYTKSRRCRDVEKSGLLCDEDLKKYRDAIFASKTGNIEADQIYDGFYDDKLYGILCFLNQNDESLISDEDCKGMAEAFERMTGGFRDSEGNWVDRNYEIAKRFIQDSYYNTGYSFSSFDNSSGGNIRDRELDELFEFSKYSILDRIAGQAGSAFSSYEKSDDGYYGALAGANLLRSLASSDETIFSTNPDKLPLDIYSVGFENGNGKATVTKVIFNPGLAVSGQYGDVDVKVINTSVSGDLVAVSELLMDFRIDDYVESEKIEFITSMAEDYVFDKIGDIPLVGEKIEDAKEFLDKIEDFMDLKALEQSAKEYKNDNTSVKSSSYPYEDLGFGLSFGDISHDSTLDFTHPSTQIYPSDKTSQVIDKAIDMFNKEKGSDYSSERFYEGVTKKISHDPTASKTSTNDFDGWCNESYEGSQVITNYEKIKEPSILNK